MKLHILHFLNKCLSDFKQWHNIEHNINSEKNNIYIMKVKTIKLEYKIQN